MTTLKGFRLEFSNGDVFEASANLRITHETQPLYLIDGLRNFTKLFNDFINDGGTPDRESTNYVGAFFGFGAGIHTIRVKFQQWEGSTETWAGVANDANAIKKLQALNRTIATTGATSDNPAILEVGEHADSGLSGTDGDYLPFAVAMGNTSLTFDSAEQSSDFNGELEMYEAVDVSNAISAVTRAEGT